MRSVISNVFNTNDCDTNNNCSAVHNSVIRGFCAAVISSMGTFSSRLYIGVVSRIFLSCLNVRSFVQLRSLYRQLTSTNSNHEIFAGFLFLFSLKKKVLTILMRRRRLPNHQFEHLCADSYRKFVSHISSSLHTKHRTRVR